MTETPTLDFGKDIEEMSPARAHDAWSEMTNLGLSELREVRDSERNDRYLDRADGNQDSDNPPIPGGPLSDAITLAETPRDEWTEKHRKEADEARNFLARTFPQYEPDQGTALIEDESPRVHKNEMSLLRGASTPNPTTSSPDSTTAAGDQVGTV
jgi:hypothetical protein